MSIVAHVEVRSDFEALVHSVLTTATGSLSGRASPGSFATSGSFAFTACCSAEHSVTGTKAGFALESGFHASGADACSSCVRCACLQVPKHTFNNQRAPKHDVDLVWRVFARKWLSQTNVRSALAPIHTACASARRTRFCDILHVNGVETYLQS